jgi:hypothetical protein
MMDDDDDHDHDDDDHDEEEDEDDEDDDGIFAQNILISHTCFCLGSECLKE